MTKQETERLVKRVQSGEQAAFEALYDEYRDRVFFFALRLVGSKEAAEDVTSETFLRALERINELRSGEAFGGWLYSIAYSLCMDMLKESARTGQLEDSPEYRLAAPVMLPDDYAVNEETKRRLGEIIDGLSPDQRSAVILYYYEELSIPEVAKALGINENNARQKLFKARSRIKKQIEKLVGSGALLSAVPLGAVLENTADQSYSKAALAGAAKIKSAHLGMKLGAIGAAAAVAVGIGIGVHRGLQGDEKPKYNELCFGSFDIFLCPQGVVSRDRNFIHFTDFDSGESTVLCSKPDCRHYDESCNAYFEEPVFEDIYGGALYVLDNGDSLNHSTLYKCEVDGSSRRAIAELDVDGVLINTYVMCDGRLYFFASSTDTVTNDMSFYPVIIDLEDGEVHKGEKARYQALSLLHADEGGMYYTELGATFDINAYLEDGREGELDALYEDPNNIELRLLRFDGEATEVIEGFDSRLQPVYYDGSDYIVHRMSDDTYCLTDEAGEVKKELISSPRSISLMQYNTVVFTDSEERCLYYDSDKAELVQTESTAAPLFLYGSRAIFWKEDIIALEEWIEGARTAPKDTEPVKLDEEYFKEHWPDKSVLHIVSDLSVCDTVNAAFNDRLAELGKDYVVDFEQELCFDTAEENISALESRRAEGAPTDIFCTGALAEGESYEPYTQSIDKGLCLPLGGLLEGSELYEAYPEAIWKCLSRGGGIYGTSGIKDIGAGLCIDIRAEEDIGYPAEITKMSELNGLLKEIGNGRTAMYLDDMLAEHIKNQNGTLVGGCIPIRLESGRPRAFDPYTTEFFEDYLGFVYEGKQSGLIGSGLSAPVIAGNRRPKEKGLWQIAISGMEDYAAPIETMVWCIASWSESPEAAFDLLEVLSRDAELNNILCYGIEGVSYTASGSTVIRTDAGDIFGAESTLGNELLLIENRENESLIRRYNDSLPVLDIGGLDLSGFEEKFEEYRKIEEKYKALLTGGDEEYEEHYKALLRELAAAGYNDTIDDINKMLNGEQNGT